MAMIDSSNILDLSVRPRRGMQSPSKNYDGEGERNLELRGIFELLSAYRGNEGGINCSKCGKLYKSKVCFVKHLWEHSVYWDLFPGDKNQERVLAIQAALILYSHHLGATREEADMLRDLLVTSPSGYDATTQSTPKKTRSVHTPLTPTSPSTPQSSPHVMLHTPTSPSTPQSTPHGMLHTPLMSISPSTAQFSQHLLSPQIEMLENSPQHYPVSYPLLSPVTPEKEFEPRLVCPATPRKDKRKLAAAKLQRTTRKKRRLLLE